MKQYSWWFVQFLCWSALIIGAGSFAGVTIRSELSSIRDRILALEYQQELAGDVFAALELALAEEQGKRIALRGLAVCNLAVLRSLGGDEANEWFAECVDDQTAKGIGRLDGDSTNELGLYQNSTDEPAPSQSNSLPMNGGR